IAAAKVGELVHEQRLAPLVTEVFEQPRGEEQPGPAAKGPQERRQRARQEVDGGSAAQPDALGQGAGLFLQFRRRDHGAAQQAMEAQYTAGRQAKPEQRSSQPDQTDDGQRGWPARGGRRGGGGERRSFGGRRQGRARGGRRQGSANEL